MVLRKIGAGIVLTGILAAIAGVTNPYIIKGKIKNEGNQPAARTMLHKQFMKRIKEEVPPRIKERLDNEVTGLLARLTLSGFSIAKKGNTEANESIKRIQEATIEDLDVYLRNLIDSDIIDIIGEGPGFSIPNISDVMSPFYGVVVWKVNMQEIEILRFKFKDFSPDMSTVKENKEGLDAFIGHLDRYAKKIALEKFNVEAKEKLRKKLKGLFEFMGVKKSSLEVDRKLKTALLQLEGEPPTHLSNMYRDIITAEKLLRIHVRKDPNPQALKLLASLHEERVAMRRFTKWLFA